MKITVVPKLHFSLNQLNSLIDPRKLPNLEAHRFVTFSGPSCRLLSLSLSRVAGQARR